MASNIKIDSGYMWLGFYFVLNLSLTLYNKIILNNFRFPYTLTAIHTLCGTIGCYVLYFMGVFTPAKLGDRENIIMVLFSVLYTINIAISNVSLSLVSVPFHQMVRAMTPVFTVMISIVFLQKSYPAKIYLSLLPVVLGVAFATCDEYTFTYMGFFLTVLGAVLASVKTIVTNRVQVGRLKLNPLDLLFRMSPLAFIQCIFYAHITGELDRLETFSAENMNWSLASGLLLNGAIAFGLNIVSFTANKKTSALTMTVAGNVKQVLSIVLSVIIFDYAINATNSFGIVLTLVGGAWYGHLELGMKKTKQVLPTTNLVSLSLDNKHEETLVEKPPLIISEKLQVTA
ncbi:triose-phosphate transporter family-domain-containing protein [Gilbertella persicaria]|uniref:triose-phosphate transporter family-domain-containing protein n=1 Tax=Gilbertella persicaria TaxID=101096 RepID=UPI00221E5C4C|nr:triose-phosphate transporter family-domain-containing protein [Gilbertella persicaria]KAI8047512.1 triose-phosphate transporter family-domain-containing protein [Gilbertella persicaria]